MGDMAMVAWAQPVALAGAAHMAMVKAPKPSAAAAVAMVFHPVISKAVSKREVVIPLPE